MLEFKMLALLRHYKMLDVLIVLVFYNKAFERLISSRTFN